MIETFILIILYALLNLKAEIYHAPRGKEDEKNGFTFD